MPAQAECISMALLFICAGEGHITVLSLTNTDFRAEFQKGWKVSKHSFVPLRRLFSVVLVVLCPQHVNSSCNNVKMGSLYVAIWKLQIHSGFLHTEVHRQPHSICMNRNRGICAIKQIEKITSGSTLIFKNTLTRGLKNVLMQTSDRDVRTLLGTSLPPHQPEEAAVPVLEQNLVFQSCIHVVCVAFAGSTTAHLPLISFLPQILPCTHPTRMRATICSLDHSISHTRIIRAGLVSALKAAASTRLLLLGQSSCSSSIPPGIAGNRVNIYPVRKGAGENNVFHKVRKWKKI